MKVRSGERVSTLTGKVEEVTQMLRDALRGAEHFNGLTKDAETAARCQFYERLLRDISEQDEQRALDRAYRGI